MRSLVVAALVTFAAASSQAAVFKCTTDKTPTTQCQYGTRLDLFSTHTESSIRDLMSMSASIKTVQGGLAHG